MIKLPFVGSLNVQRHFLLLKQEYQTTGNRGGSGFFAQKLKIYLENKWEKTKNGSLFPFQTIQKPKKTKAKAAPGPNGLDSASGSHHRH